MSDQFVDLHQIHHFGDMSEHSVDVHDLSTSVNSHGSENITRSDGIHEWAIKNAEGGEDIYHGSALYEKTIPGVHGSHDVYDSHMQLKATVVPNVHHGHDVLHGASLIESSIPSGHETSTVMHYSDPLAHLSEFTWTKLILS